MGRGWGVPAPGQDLELWPSSSSLGQGVALGEGAAAMVSTFAASDSGTSYASWSTPDTTYHGAGGGDTSGNTGGDYTSPQEAAETEAENQWLWGIGDAVASGDAASYVNDHLEVVEEVWCDPFEVPTGGECPTPYVADCVPPCIRPSSVCSVEELPWWEVVGRYTFEVVYPPQLDSPQGDAFGDLGLPEVLFPVSPGLGWSDDDVDRAAVLIQYGWAVLIDNLDLVEWIVCLYYGQDLPADDDQLFDSPNSTVAECITSRILGDPLKVTIRFGELESGVFSGSVPQWWNGVPGGQITVTDLIFSKYVLPFEVAGAAGDLAEQFCLVADLAASLLHELVHTCRNADPLDWPNRGENEADQCSTSYLIENAFRYALGLRYSCLTQTSGCYFYAYKSLWGSDGAAYPGAPPDGVGPP